jgi:hypothetical protein
MPDKSSQPEKYIGSSICFNSEKHDWCLMPAILWDSKKTWWQTFCHQNFIFSKITGLNWTKLCEKQQHASVQDY